MYGSASILTTVVLSKSGKGRHPNMYTRMTGIPRFFHVARGRKTLQTYGFPIETWETLKCHNLNMNQQSPPSNF